MKDKIVKFKVGETYSIGSIGDHNAVWYYRIVKRTAKSVWVFEVPSPNYLPPIDRPWTAVAQSKRKKIDVFQDVETCFPQGTYSLAPILKADSKCYLGDPAEEGIRAAKEDARRGRALIEAAKPGVMKSKPNEPEQGKQYRLTGATGTPCIAKGNTWAESEVNHESKL